MTYQDLLKKVMQYRRNSQLNALFRIIGICIIAGIIAGAYVAFKHTGPGLYTSKQDNFQIAFPGTPTIEAIPAKSDGSGGTETGRLYSVIKQSNGSDYAIYVVRYSNSNANSISASETVAALESDIGQIAQSDNAAISNGKTSSFNNLTAVEATLTPKNTADAPADVLAFLKSNDLYMILGGGLNQSQFDAFTGSFRFL
jgi:hypothetical protein